MFEQLMPCDDDNSPVQNWLARGHMVTPAQQALFIPQNPDVDVCLFQGGYGCGKTHAAVLQGIELACMQPGSVGLVVSPTADALDHNLLPMYRKILKMLGLDDDQTCRIRWSKRCITFINGSQILFRPANTRSQAFKHIECQWLHAENLGDMAEPTFRLLLTRLRQPLDYPVGCQLRFFGTSVPTTGWLQTRFAPDNPYGYRKIMGHLHDNTALPTGFNTLMQTVWSADNPEITGQDVPDFLPHNTGYDAVVNPMATPASPVLPLNLPWIESPVQAGAETENNPPTNSTPFTAPVSPQNHTAHSATLPDGLWVSAGQSARPPSPHTPRNPLSGGMGVEG